MKDGRTETIDRLLILRLSRSPSGDGGWRKGLKPTDTSYLQQEEDEKYNLQVEVKDDIAR